MKITVEDGILDLPEGFSFDIEHNHPFYSEAGVASVPVTLPASADNKRILGWPDNINRSSRFIKEKPAFLECGPFSKKCLLIIDSSGNEGISISLALQESEMYASIQERKLKDVFTGISYGMSKMNIATPYEIYTGMHRENWYLNDVALFPVACDMTDEGNVFIINNPTTDKIIDDSRTLNIGDSQVTVPAGYGVSPYLYLWACVQYTFESLGYEVRTNDILNDPFLKEIVLLHNLADPCCEFYDLKVLWGFQYADLVPDITVGELLVWLHDKFGIIVTYDAGTVDIRTFEGSISNAQPDLDLTLYMRSNPTVNYPDSQGLKLSVGTSVSGAEPAAESIEDLHTLYPNCGHANHKDNITGTGLFFVDPVGKYFYSDGQGNVSLLGSNAFPYVRRMAESNVEISTNDEFVPMFRVGDIYMPYIGERAHKYIQAGESAPAQNIKICYAHFLNSGVYHGSTNSYDKDGNALATDYPSLTPEDIKKYWWNTHERILLNSAPMISAELDMPLSLILSSDLSTPKLLNGARVLIKDMTYSISDAETALVKATLQVLPVYDDMLSGPTVDFGVSYGWRLENTRYIYNGNGYEITSTDGLEDYTMEDAPSYKPTCAGSKVLIRDRWLKYKYTQKYKKWWGYGTSTHTGTHKWQEYFISESTE